MNTRGARNQTTPRRMGTMRMLSQRPVRAIWGRVRCPLAKTMALGGVPTGIMKEQLAARAAGMRKSSGSCPRVRARAATMGRKVVAVAVLLVSSVSIRIPKQTMARVSNMGKPPSPWQRSPR